MPAEPAGAALPGVPDPFPGLRPFESGEEAIFRGRQQHTDELLRRLAAHRFLAVVGTSGSGKSSLVRAGLLPALDRGYLAGATSRWRIAVMRPGMAPIENLAAALRDPDALGAADPAKLRSSRLGLVEAVRDAKLAPGESLLVVADQFEEVFRYQRRMSEIDGGAEAALFVSLLLTAAERPDAPVYVVLTMRSDFLGDCAQFPGLPEALSESQYLIPRLTREQRRQAIEEPLRLFRAGIAPRLVEQLLNDSGDELGDPAAISSYRGGAPDTLPVLQHALMRTYQEWKQLPPDEAGTRIDLAHYAAAGRMASALGRHAEHVFTEELDDAGRMWAQRIFRCVTTTEMGRPVRRPTPLADLYQIVGARPEDQPKIGEVLALFGSGDNSFLRVNRDTSVDLSHESLIWKWPLLSRWVAAEASNAELYRDLVKDAQGEATWGEPKLSAALERRAADAWNPAWARQYSAGRFEDVEAFLDRSRRAVRKQKLIRWFGVGAAAVVVVLVVIASLLFHENSMERQQVAALKELNDRSVKDLEARKRNIKEQEDRIAGLNARAGSTKEERDRIAKEKASAEDRLKQYQEETQKQQVAQAQQSTDIVAGVKSLQNRLDAEIQKRKDAESKLAQLEAKGSPVPAGGGAAPAPAPPRINSFVAEPDLVVLGSEGELRWSVSNATEVSIDQGVGVVPASGTRRFSPYSITYTLTARGPGGVESHAVPVQVRAPSEMPIPVPVEVQTRVNPKDGLTYVWIPPGEFTMGCSPGDYQCQPNEKPPHAVTISRGFWLGQTEVTQAAFAKFAPNGKQHFTSPRQPHLPAVNLTWDDARRYCEWAGMRLPTEAEWEYAARAGTAGPRYAENLDAIAWYNFNGAANLHPPRGKEPNRWWLYDMLGNMLEWVADWYDERYYDRGVSQDPPGPARGADRVLRGGSWGGFPKEIRASHRVWHKPDDAYFYFGCRCAGDLR
ncbi:MAG TPA: SUMF1/EgtB/PvdO family nonheme iron enzyme [Candidatus Acidoferrales bacterium]|nr:SUMF1/EgtB/PvdO family nonheme iron enzyme [Candidatus Acidoferrales bacterium]